MIDDSYQSLLFGNPDVVDDADACTELRLLALNMQSPSLGRSTQQLDWLFATRCNVLVLTEVKVNDVYSHLVKELRSSGFTVMRPEPGVDDPYVALVATKGFAVRPVSLTFSSTRVIATRLTTHLGDLDVIGLYALTNGMNYDSSRQRKAFQTAIIAALRARISAEPAIPLLVAGDFNVLEPGHIPASTLYEEHDYDFYRSFAGLGLVDAYRHVQHEGRDLTWYGPQGGQRLDHAFLSASEIHHLTECSFDHAVRSRKLSDHSALKLTLA